MSQIWQPPSLRDRLVMPDEPIFSSRWKRKRSPIPFPSFLMNNGFPGGTYPQGSVFACKCDLYAGLTTSDVIDETNQNNVILQNGAILSTAQSVSGGRSVLFSYANAQSSLRIPVMSSLWNFGTNNFVVSFDVYMISATNTDGDYLFSLGGGYNYSWHDLGLAIYPTGNTLVSIRSSAVADSANPDIAFYPSVGTITLGAWRRIQLYRIGTTFGVKINSSSPSWTVSSGLGVKWQGPTNKAGVNFGGGGYAQNGSGVPTPHQDSISGYIDNIYVNNGQYIDTFATAGLP